MIRPPAPLREDAPGPESREVYRADLALVEALIATPTEAPVGRAPAPVDERAAGLDGDGELGVATTLRGLPARWAARDAVGDFTRAGPLAGLLPGPPMKYVDLPDARRRAA